MLKHVSDVGEVYAKKRFCFSSLSEHEDNEKDLDWKFEDVSSTSTLASILEVSSLG